MPQPEELVVGTAFGLGANVVGVVVRLAAIGEVHVVARVDLWAVLAEVEPQLGVHAIIGDRTRLVAKTHRVAATACDNRLDTDPRGVRPRDTVLCVVELATLEVVLEPYVGRAAGTAAA